MKTGPLAPNTEAEIWLRILHPDEELSPPVARVILGLSFPEGINRMHELSAKARAGTLTADEDAEMDNFERVGSILSTLKSKARQTQAFRPRRLTSDGHPSRRARLGAAFTSVVNTAECRRSTTNCPSRSITWSPSSTGAKWSPATLCSPASLTTTIKARTSQASIQDSQAHVALQSAPPQIGPPLPLDAPILVGRTAVGRATIAVLGINLPHRAFGIERS